MSKTAVALFEDIDWRTVGNCVKAAHGRIEPDVTVRMHNLRRTVVPVTVNTGGGGVWRPWCLETVVPVTVNITVDAGTAGELNATTTQQKISALPVGVAWSGSDDADSIAEKKAILEDGMTDETVVPTVVPVTVNAKNISAHFQFSPTT